MTDDAPHGEQPREQDQADVEPDQDDPGIDAEAWLAERGVRREPIRVRPDTLQGKSDGTPPPRPPEPPAPPSSAAEEPVAEPEPDGVGRPTTEEPAPEPAPDRTHPNRPRAEDQVAKAVAYVRRATAKTPMSEGRVRRRLGERDHPEAIIEQTLRRCRAEGLVDDRSFARALVEEGRDKGHAPLRIRRDLERREFSDEVIEEALDEIADRDPEASAFAVARERAERLRGVDAETAYRRLVSYLARRGYTNALSRKVARQAVFDEREDERIAGR